MTFSDLVFDKAGCCGLHNWAEYLEDTGVRVQVFDNGDGTFNVVKSAGNLLLSNVSNVSQEEVAALL